MALPPRACRRRLLGRDRLGLDSGRRSEHRQLRDGSLMRLNRRAEAVPNRSLDVVFYMPWLGPLLAAGAAPAGGGAETQILLLAKALAARGWRVGVVTQAMSPPLPSEVDGLK